TLQKMILCPSAKKTSSDTDWIIRPGKGENPYMAWDDIDYDDLNYYCKGSYGINLWSADKEGSGKLQVPGQAFWRTPYVRGAAYAPIMMDSQWKDADPADYDEPMPFELSEWTQNDHEMQRFQLNRHGKYNVNGVFMDFSAKTVTSKGLWYIRWHQLWPTTPFAVAWPAWMDHIPEPLP
ncbi:MAG: hypothetical protein ACYSP9_04070, partial [Planctomycetota bacterium]